MFLINLLLFEDINLLNQLINFIFLLLFLYRLIFVSVNRHRYARLVLGIGHLRKIRYTRLHQRLSA